MPDKIMAEEQLEDLANSALEIHLETGIEINKWPELQALIHAMYPGLILSEGKIQNYGNRFDIYRLEVTFNTDTPDGRFIRVGKKRMNEMLNRILMSANVTYVNVVKEDRR